MKPITGIIKNSSLTDTPARVNMRTGEMEVSEEFFKLPPEFRVFILCHEYGHRLGNTRDEKEADNIALRFYANLGYPLSKAVLALATVLNSDSSYHISRAEAVYNLAKEFDQKVYQPHSDFVNLTSQQNRVKLMKRHKNERLREIAQLIRQKKYTEAKSLITSELKTIEPGAKLEKPYRNLVKLVDKAAQCAPTGQNKRPAKSATSAGFNSEEHFSDFTDELEGFADEMESIASFNDVFDSYVGEVEAIMAETQNFAGQDEIAEILGGDFGDIQGFSDDIAEFTEDEQEPANPFVYASLKGKQKAKKTARVDKREARKDKRLENRTKLVDAKVTVKQASADAKKTKANAKQTLADQGISTGFKLDKGTLDGALNAAGGVLNAATGGAGGMLGKLMGKEGADTSGGGDTGAGTTGGVVTTDPEVKTAGGGIPTWVWIVGGVVLAAAIGAGIWFFTRPKKAAKAK